jgi:hypothetical protein
MRASSLRHDTVILSASPTSNYEDSSRKPQSDPRPTNAVEPLTFVELLSALALAPTKVLTIAALHQGNYATIANYLETELRYMVAGE